MTIENITYYIEKDMEEGFYGADCDLREMAHIEVLEWLKELQAHREAWDGIKEGLLEMSRLHEYVSIKHMLQLIDGIRPKEGDNE